MRDIRWLQERLLEHGAYEGKVDGLYGPLTRQGIMKALKDGPDYPLTEQDIRNAAGELNVEIAAVWAVVDVESSGRAFTNGMATILFEPHRFARATGQKYNQSHPHISSRSWNKKLYPGTQAGRWEQVLDAVALNVDAAFASASYGAFQILGENYAICGATSPWSFAWQENQTEADQLAHFIKFVQANKLEFHLRNKDWAKFARGYNGTAFKQNQYDTKLDNAYKKRSQG